MLSYVQFFAPCGLLPDRLLCAWDSPCKNTGVGNQLLLQEIFLTQGSNSCLLSWQVNSSTLAWKIPWTEEPGRPLSIGSLRVGHVCATSLSLFTFHFHALEKEMATHSSVLAWRIPGMGEPGGLPSLGSHRVGHD